MVWLKAALGLALLATAVWLISVLDLQIGRVASLTMAFLLAVILLVLAFARALPSRWRAAVPVAVLLIAVMQVSVPLRASVTTAHRIMPARRPRVRGAPSPKRRLPG